MSKSPHGSKAVPAWVWLGLATTALAVAGGGLFLRANSAAEVKQWTAAQATPFVSLAKLTAGAPEALVLPATTEAFATAPIHARVSGYVKRWLVDIGQTVKTGQDLAEIDAPDIDQQVSQAKADLAAAIANQKLSDVTAKRYAALIKTGFVSQADNDAKQSDLAAKIAATASAKANLDRLIATAGFKRIVAPFNGVVVSRSTDVGALTAAGSTTDAPLFTLADIHILRIFVQIPQSLAGQLHVGDSADITAPEVSSKGLTAKIARIAGGLDAQSDSLRIELDYDNADGKLRPGEYVQAHFNLPSPPTSVRAPATAVAFRHLGQIVAPVVFIRNDDGRVKQSPVTIARDAGATLDLSSGVTLASKVIDNPPETLSDGDKVALSPTK